MSLCLLLFGVRKMRANEFVKKFGWDRAKREVALIGTIAAMCCDGGFNDDLKRLVESWELVEKLGGLNKSKKVAKKSYDSCSSIISDRTTGFECKWVELNKAIKDVESCQ